MRADKFLVADDHAIVRAGVKTLMKDLRPLAQGDEAINGNQAIDLVKSNNYDIIILDVNMPDTDCITMVSNILAYKEKSKILIFSMKSEELYAKRFLKLGVLGYLDKESDAQEIKKAIESVLNGLMYMSPNLKKHFYEDMMAKRTENPFEKLSNREIQIAKYLLLGYSHAEIKKTLNLHSSTVGTHRLRFFEKLKIKNLFELAELVKLYHVDLSRL
jgi:two-component system, NarL family, invasion response regulator UvrY